MGDLTAAEVREWLDYDPATGIFTWKKQRGQRGKIGSRAGAINKVNGYREIQLLGVRVYEHCLIWLWVTGNWPKEDIDHINRIRDDNCFSNLREASRQQNIINSVRQPNATGYRGVYRVKENHQKKFIARICVNYKTVNLGCFATAEEAHVVVLAKRQELSGEFVDPTLWVYK